MPLPNFVLVMLIGLVLGTMAAVVLKSRGLTFIVNIVLGILGACLGAFAPVMLGNSLAIDTSTLDYLLRSVLGAFVMLLVASLFRPARAPNSF